MPRISLPPPDLETGPRLAAAIDRRRSCRAFLSEPLPLAQIGQILWAAAGRRIGDRQGRTAPSAGGCYPIDLFLATGAGSVPGLDAAVYLYDAESHGLVFHRNGDARPGLARAALDQQFIATAPVSILLAGEARKTTSQYGGERGMRYVYMDAGHMGQNIYLQAAALDLGTVAVGAFRDLEVLACLNLPGSRSALYLFPIGRPSGG